MKTQHALASLRPSRSLLSRLPLLPENRRVALAGHCPKRMDVSPRHCPVPEVAEAGTRPQTEVEDRRGSGGTHLATSKPQSRRWQVLHIEPRRHSTTDLDRSHNGHGGSVLVASCRRSNLEAFISGGGAPCFSTLHLTPSSHTFISHLPNHRHVKKCPLQESLKQSKRNGSSKTVSRPWRPSNRTQGCGDRRRSGTRSWTR